MKNKNLLILLVVSMTGSVMYGAKEEFKVTSPDNKTSIIINTSGENLQYSIEKDNRLLISPSDIGMKLDGGELIGKSPKVLKSSTRKVKSSISAPLYKRSSINEEYNELTLSLKGNYGLQVRAYDDGVAYRFTTNKKGEIVIIDELFEASMPQSYPVTVAYANAGEMNKDIKNNYFNSFENTYETVPVEKVADKHLAILPLMIDAGQNTKIVISEVNLYDYPGTFMYNPTKDRTLSGHHAPAPKSLKQGGHNELQMIVEERENYIAKSKGKRDFPWRAFVISDNDVDLVNSDLVYKLADPSKIEDTSWIKPGKVAWDWWNDWTIYGVDFKPGINNDTYKYYIDFASQNGIEYVILDEGWAVNKKADLFMIIPEINIEELVKYADDKNVGLILWAGYHAINKDMENVCKHYSEMGIKGFKVDFMNRDDQDMVGFYNRMAETAAKYKLLVDYHGAYKPTGLNRTYPNAINFEGVFGLEQMKWIEPSVDMVKYDVTMPYIRMVAGPVDYTQGAMKNASRKSFKSIYSEPMSQGTRCRQLALYAIFESPLNMLCDSPSNYINEKECTDIIAEIPTVWDQTVGVDGKVGEYITMARQKGDTWYVGGITDWNPRKQCVDLSFLGDGEFTGELFFDGLNADKAGRDYRKESIKIPANKKIDIQMASGGGFLLKITKK